MTLLRNGKKLQVLRCYEWHVWSVLTNVMGEYVVVVGAAVCDFNRTTKPSHSTSHDTTVQHKCNSQSWIDHRKQTTTHRNTLQDTCFSDYCCCGLWCYKDHTPPSHSTTHNSRLGRTDLLMMCAQCGDVCPRLAAKVERHTDRAPAAAPRHHTQYYLPTTFLHTPIFTRYNQRRQLYAEELRTVQWGSIVMSWFCPKMNCNSWNIMKPPWHAKADCTRSLARRLIFSRIFHDTTIVPYCTHMNIHTTVRRQYYYFT